MPPKGKKGGGDKGRSEAEETEEILQAVVLADSFETRFRPLTLEKPRCLLPLANTPLIEYTLESLAASGVQEVFLYCGAHTSQVESYIQASKWTAATSPFTLHLLRSTSTSVGDAMRTLDAKGLLTDDFVLVYGDVVTNIALQPALAVHKARKAADKNCIMTAVLRSAGLGHETGTQEVLPCWVLGGDGRCLGYEQIPLRSGGGGETTGRKRKGKEGGGAMLELDNDMLAHDELSLRTDLIDCGVDIVTPDVLALWSDNFDYEEPRRGFLHSVLKDYELNGKKIYTYIEEEGYAARARNLRTYAAISGDVVGRWTYPLVPDSNLLKDQTYRLHKGGAYREEGVVLAANCEVGKRTVVGRATAVGDKAMIRDSVVGRRCVIGRNVRLQGAYIWDDVTIGDGSVVTDSIVANEASVGKRCTIKPGCVVSYGCHVADGTTLEDGTRVTRVQSTGRGEETSRGDTDPNVVGKGGEGFAYEDLDDDDEGQAFGLAQSDFYSLSGASLSQESISTIHLQDDLTVDSDGPGRRGSRTASFGSDITPITTSESLAPGGAAADGAHSTKDARDFHRDASAQIYEALQQGVDWNNIQLELTGLRLASDADPYWVRRSVVVAFMKYVSTLVDGGMSAAQAVKKTILPQEQLLKRTIGDYGEKHSDKKDQVDFLLLMQSDLRHRKEGETIMLFASNELAIQDIIETEGFTQWWEDDRSTEGDEMLQVRSKMQPFMDAIADDESEEESEDEDDED